MSRIGRGRLAMFALAMSLLSSSVSRAAKLSEVFPELAERKGSLGRTILLTDVVIVDDIAGKVEKVKLGRSWTLALLAIQSMRDSLARRGYTVDTAIVAAIGSGLDPRVPFQSDSVKASGPDDTEHLLRAPFYTDSLFMDADRRELWRKTLISVWTYGRKKGKPIGYLAEPISLGSQLGYDTVGILFGVTWGIPATKQFLAALGGTAINSTTNYRFLLADARSGHVLWASASTFPAGADELNLAKALEQATKDLP